MNYFVGDHLGEIDLGVSFGTCSNDEVIAYEKGKFSDQKHLWNS